MTVPAEQASTPGAKARKHPQRSCIACRRQRDKRDLVRLVRDASGVVAVDERGRASGRGAYLCRDLACWELALEGNAIERALRSKVADQDRATLRTFAAERLTAHAEGGTR